MYRTGAQWGGGLPKMLHYATPSRWWIGAHPSNAPHSGAIQIGAFAGIAKPAASFLCMSDAPNLGAAQTL